MLIIVFEGENRFDNCSFNRNEFLISGLKYVE